MRVVALPNHEFPPGGGALVRADLVLERVDRLTVEALERLDR
jgi:hypothetical protein